jgi:lysophospholipid acyltransferase (LPLAT)-like uncharacterized protein
MRDANPVCALGSVSGARRESGTGYPVPGARHSGPKTWHPYRIPMPEGEVGIPMGFPVHVPKNAHTRYAGNSGQPPLFQTRQPLV